MKRPLLLVATLAIPFVAGLALIQSAGSTAAQARAELAPPVIHEPFTAMPCPKQPVSTPDLEGCIEHRLLSTDRRIDKLDARLFAELEGPGFEGPRLQRRLLAGFRAWLTYRRSDCGDLWASTEEGTIYPVVTGNCELARNRQRIEDLREVLAFPERP